MVVTPDGWVFGYIPMIRARAAEVYDAALEERDPPELESGSESGRLVEAVADD